MSKDNIACVKDVVREDVREGGREEVGYKDTPESKYASLVHSVACQ